MPRNSFVQMSKLHNVRGRIYYISSDKKQENLYAVYETTDRNFWTDLAKYNQAFLALTALTDRNMLDVDNIKEPILRYLVKRYQEIKENENEDLKPWIDKIVDWFDMALPSSSDEVFTNVMKNKFQNISKDLADAVYLSIAKSISPDYMDDDAGIEDDGTDDYLYDKCDD